MMRLAFNRLPALAAACLLLSTAPEVQSQRRVLSLTGQQLTEQVAARFPQRRCLLAMACVTVKDPVVRLKNGDPRLFVTAQAIPDMGAQPMSAGVIEMAGEPRYDAARGAFFIDAPEILRLDFPDLPAGYVAPATEMTRELLVGYLRQTPVWVLDERDAQQALARLVLRQVEVRDGALRLTIGDDD